MKRSLVLKISLYLGAFVLANFIVLWFGPKGLIITALLLIPFDFVVRCLFHETWKGMELIFKLGALVAFSGLLTYLINSQAQNIALASVIGYTTAQVGAGVFYQFFIRSPYWVKVNGSDLVGIIIDSIIFQLVAFNDVDPWITFSQTGLKMVGGVFWYWVIFVKLKWNNE
jgi:uncharacterized PurR-regulated membrane protein YhhQ (DUF165 family)